MFDGKAFGDAVVSQVRQFVDRALAPLDQRVKALEERLAASVSVTGAVIDRDGNLVLTRSDGTTQTLGAVVGKDGRDGKDGERGEPGFSLESFEVLQNEDGRTIELKFEGGDMSYTRELELPLVIYRGVYKDDETYAVGDMVTWGGSVWHCTAAEAGKPGEDTTGWVLAVKKGRDGRDGKDGERGLQGKTGPAGRDLTQMGPDGRKW